MPWVPIAFPIEINGYTLTEHVSTGGMANAYAAKTKDGRKVFFKLYKSPTVAVKWYPDYLRYMAELNRRVCLPALTRFCVKHIESFEWARGSSKTKTFFQVFEFVEGGHDLSAILQRAAKRTHSLNWQQRLIMAKVFMASIHQLHAQKIVHGDLKPANVQMLEDTTVTVRYRPLLIDMDFSVLADMKAPWHGDKDHPYVGTPRYFSPEHLRGQVPQTASDVFTCGNILYELLAQGHPFPCEDEDGYGKAVLAGNPPAPRLQGTLDREESTARLCSVLRACLAVDPAKRPTAEVVNRALNGLAPVTSAPVVAPAPKLGATAPDPKRSDLLASCATAPTSARPASKKLSITLRGDAGQQTISSTMEVGRSWLQQVALEAKHAHDPQFRLESGADGWQIIPHPNTANKTLLNGKEITASASLKHGDIIAVGSRRSDKTAMRLNVETGT